MTEARAQGQAALRQCLGRDAVFRDGQWEAIAAVAVRRERALVVQKTGWGKSLVYFIATRLMRDRGSGPTLIVSPLLALMRDQVRMAERIGIRSATLNSSNRDDWNAIEERLRGNDLDDLLVSPERLGNDRLLRQTLPAMRAGADLLVIDVAVDVVHPRRRLRHHWTSCWTLRGEKRAGLAPVVAASHGIR